MKILSFDTSTPTLSVALMHDGKVVAEKEVPPIENRQQAVSQLMPTIDSLVKSMGWEPKALDLLVVGIGPGSFTGLRTCVVTGRTLAQALDRPIIGIDAFQCYATRIDLPAAIVLSGGRGHYFVAGYSLSGAGPGNPEAAYAVCCNGLTLRWAESDGLLESLIEARCATAAELPELLKDCSRIYCDPASIEALNDSLSGCLPLPELTGIAVTQAQVAFRAHNLGHVDRESLLTLYSFQRVNPLYLRGASITLKKTDVGQPEKN